MAKRFTAREYLVLWLDNQMRIEQDRKDHNLANRYNEYIILKKQILEMYEEKKEEN